MKKNNHSIRCSYKWLGPFCLQLLVSLGVLTNKF